MVAVTARGLEGGSSKRRCDSAAGPRRVPTGSDFTWQVQADAAYRFSKLFQLGLGYRALGIDYESGSGQDRFLFDMDTFGPVLKFTFNL